MGLALKGHTSWPHIPFAGPQPCGHAGCKESWEMRPSFLEKRNMFGEHEAIFRRCAAILVKTDEVPI